MEKKTTLCRVAFCQDCYDRGRPSKGSKFVTIGRTRQKFFIRTVTKNGQRGFVPHIVERISNENGVVQFYSHCAMDKCGCSVKLDKSKVEESYLVDIITDSVKTLPIVSWNAMVCYTGDSQYYLG